MNGFSRASTGLCYIFPVTNCMRRTATQTMRDMARRFPALVPTRHKADQVQGLPDTTDALLPVARSRACTLPTAA